MDFSAVRISDPNGSMGANIGAESLLELGSFYNVETSRTTLDIVKDRLTELGKQRGEFGAIVSRIQVSRAVLETSMIANKSAESRIRDIDVAEETTKLASAQILQKTGAAVLAQANQQPQIALQLLDL